MLSKYLNLHNIEKIFPKLKPQKIKVMTLFFIHLFICAYIVWGISPPSPLLPPPPLLPGRTSSALFSNSVEEKTKAIIRKTKLVCS
jgi:hypothetical protein